MPIFLLKKCEKLLQCKGYLIFSTKNFGVFGYKVVKHLTSWPLNELVKLTMLCTTGPWSAYVSTHYNLRLSCPHSTISICWKCDFFINLRGRAGWSVSNVHTWINAQFPVTLHLIFNNTYRVETVLVFRRVVSLSLPIFSHFSVCFNGQKQTKYNKSNKNKIYLF